MDSDSLSPVEGSSGFKVCVCCRANEGWEYHLWGGEAWLGEQGKAYLEERMGAAGMRQDHGEQVEELVNKGQGGRSQAGGVGG